jgi:hypothetical protein
VGILMLFGLVPWMIVLVESFHNADFWKMLSR